MRNPHLRRFWFKRLVGIGYGVTAYSLEDAEQHLCSSGLPRDWVTVVEDVDVSLLDPHHVLPNVGAVIFPGVWFPALKL
jgi:hypothetical protein